MSVASKVEVLTTTPFSDQKPGTSGLRKKVKHVQQPNYLANFIQALFNALPESEYKDRILLCSGDGRYWNKEAIKIIAEIAAGNGVKRLWVCEKGLVSTPAASCIIREREGGVCAGGILLTASHNPGGVEGDFGVKFNCGNGGPAPESVTDEIFKRSQELCEYKRMSLPDFDFCGGALGEVLVTDSGFTVEVIDGCEDWLKLMQRVFDFGLLRRLVQQPGFNFVYDAMNGVGGIYGRRLFVDLLGADATKCLMRCEPLEDFGGCHPDPNLTYAGELVERMAVKNPEAAEADTPDFGAAGDGDNDRNMILGKGWFVTPSDSVAIIASYAEQCIPWFSAERGGLRGLARSMPTSMALAHVASALGKEHYEVPTGWKFFGNLMDAGRCSLCGEESFGTGSDHVREKDGLWAVLAWMSIIGWRYQTAEWKTPVTVKQINLDFWRRFGRCHYTRYDYEQVESEAAAAVVRNLLDTGREGESALANLARDERLSQLSREFLETNPIHKIDQFDYVDPVDNSVSRNQGTRVLFSDGSRFVLRLSGTGSVGATIRLYLERYTTEPDKISLPTAEAMEDFVGLALDLTKIEKFTGRKHPTVIT